MQPYPNSFPFLHIQLRISSQECYVVFCSINSDKIFFFFSQKTKQTKKKKTHKKKAPTLLHYLYKCFLKHVKFRNFNPERHLKPTACTVVLSGYKSGIHCAWVLSCHTQYLQQQLLCMGRTSNISTPSPGFSMDCVGVQGTVVAEVLPGHGALELARTEEAKWSRRVEVIALDGENLQQRCREE